jgi:VCBS repeat-containing protein
VSVTASPSTSLGTFALAAVSEAANAANGTVDWTYTVDDSKAQYLAAGETVTETYTVTVDDKNGSTTTQDVVITITGTNDLVSITSGVQAGSVAEDSAAAHAATGTIAFTDADLKDGHTVSVTASPSTSLGTFALAAVSEAANAANGTVDWTYTVDDSKAQYLAVGETVTETYTVTVDDKNGSTTTQDVVITITGTNDVVSITSGIQAGSVAEDSTTAHAASGTIAFTDADLKDGHTAAFAAAAGNTTSLGKFALAAVAEADNAANGTVGWTYTVDDSKAQYLAAGEQVTETYTVTVDDKNGSTTTQDVVITITGTNDVVSITSGIQAGSVAEDSTTAHAASGTIAFTDVDLKDGHTAAFAAAAGNTTSLGKFALAAVAEADNAANGSVGWTYTVDDSKAQYLAAGETVTETYTVTVDDKNGSTTTQDVVITITGTNDLVSITSGVQAGSVAEDSAAAHAATGTIAFTDADLKDGHTVSVTASPSTSLGTFALAAVSEAANAANGTVDWTYTVDDSKAQYLAVGETVTETYTVTVDDKNGSTTTQDVVITITGTNDVVSITSGIQAGSVAEDSTTAHAASGTIAFTDADLKDGHTAAFAAAAGNTTSLGKFALAAVAEADNAANGTVGWTYTVDDSKAQYLAAGQTATESFTVTLDDHHGGTVDQVVTVTVTGTNDGPTITAAATDAIGAVTEDAAATTLTDTGTIAFGDLDLTDTHTATVAAAAANTLGGTLTLGAAAESGTTADGTIGWTYAVANSATQYLAVGQAATESFTVTLDDRHGGTVDQVVTVTVTGTNDAPVISLQGTDSAAVNLNEANAALTASGTLTVTDVDLSDTDATTVIGVAASGATTGLNVDNGTLKAMLTLSQANVAANLGDSHNLTWNFNSASQAFDYLAAGEKLTLTYMVAAADASTNATQQVTVTITGTNDAPILNALSGISYNDTAADDTFADSIGKLSSTDRDANDTKAFSITGGIADSSHTGFNLSKTDTYGTLYLNSSTGDYKFIANDAVIEGLKANATTSFELSVTDGSNAKASQTVNIMLTGVNDTPNVTAPVVTQTTNEDVAKVFSAANGNQISVSDRDDTSHTITLTAANGTISLSGTNNLTFSSGDGTADSTMTFSGSDSAINTALNGVSFVGSTNYNGAASIQIVASDGSTSDTRNVGITINSVNDAPSGTDKTIKIDEDSSYTLAASDFGFTDVSDSPTNSLQAVKISSLPTAGSLTLSGIAVTVGQVINAENLSNLVFTPLADANGTGYSHFTFQVQDNGGTANGGVDLSQGSNTLTFNVAAVNDAPVVDLNTNMQGLGNQVTFTEMNGPDTGANAVFFSAGGTNINDVDSANLANLKVSLSTLSIAAGDQLRFGTTAIDITGNTAVGEVTANGTVFHYAIAEAGGTRTVTFNSLTGSGGSSAIAPKASYEALLDGLKYNNTSDTPVDNSTRTFGVTVNDSAADSAAATFTVTLKAVADTDTTPPTASITHTLIQGEQRVTFTVQASDASGIARVELYEDGTTLLGTATTRDANGNYVFTFDAGSTYFAKGSTHTITATVTDRANNSITVIDPTQVKVDNPNNNSTKFTQPAGVAGEPIQLALANPTSDQSTPVTILVSGMPADWTLSAGTNNGSGTWTVQTNNPESLTVTTPANFTGAMVLDIAMNWTNADGTIGSLQVNDNVEAYAPGSPIFALSSDDNLTGSSGNDLFVFAQPIANDVIYSFDAAHDKIDLIGFTGVNGYADLSIADDANRNAVITTSSGSTITVKGVHASDLTASNFDFNVEPVSTNTGTLTLSDGAIMPFGGVLNNSGTIELKSAGSETQLEVLVESLKLQGGGHVTLSDSDYNVISGGAASAKLINIDNTISGAGQIGAGQMTLDNRGIIIADGSHALVIDTGANTVANSGTLEATGAGGLVIDSALDNSGKLWANGGNLTVHGDVSGSGSAVISGAAVLELDGVANVAVSFDAGGSGSLKLGDADHFSGSIAGFGGNDSLRLADIAVKAGSALSFVADASGGTLTVSDGTSTAHLALQGSYANAGFIATADQGGMLLTANVADANQNLHGTDGIDLLASGAGNDILAGGAGNDVLFGGGGSDTFVFDTALNGASNVDTILDFQANGDADYIFLSQKVFGSLTGTGGTLDAWQFAAVNDGSGAAALLDAGVHLIYDSQTGSLYYDADGANTAEGRTVVAVIGTFEHPSGAHITNDVFKFG